MATDLRQVKGDVESAPWGEVLTRFQAATRGMTGEAVAALDPDVDQKLANRWKNGDLKREPTGPKMAAMRRIVRLLEAGPSGEYARGIMVAIERTEAMLKDLRALLVRSVAEGPDVGGEVEEKRGVGG